MSGVINNFYVVLNMCTSKLAFFLFLFYRGQRQLLTAAFRNQAQKENAQ